MAREKALREESPFQSTEKVMQTFRMTRELITFLKGEAAEKGLDLTAYVNRMLDGVAAPGSASPRPRRISSTPIARR